VKGGGVEPERMLEGQQLKSWVENTNMTDYLQSINSEKHLPQSPFTGDAFCFGVYIVNYYIPVPNQQQREGQCSKKKYLLRQYNVLQSPIFAIFDVLQNRIGLAVSLCLWYTVVDYMYWFLNLMNFPWLLKYGR
jgi:hypothetical protein